MKKNVLAALVIMLCTSSGVMAANDAAITDGSVTFNGKVIAPACTLVSGQENSTVTLPDVSATKLQTNGEVSGVQTDVPIELKDCDITVTDNAQFTFSGDADTIIPTAFANKASGGAQNVALQLYMPDGTTVITPNVETGDLALQTGDQTLTFKVDYIATARATSGDVTAVANFHINYY